MISSGVPFYESFHDREPGLCHRRPAPVQDRGRSGEMTAFLSLSVHQKFQNLFLHRYIQCTGCLITDQDFGFYCKSSGNCCSLALSSADLMRITVCIFRIQAASSRRIFHTFPGFLLTYPHIPETFPNSVPQRTSGIKRFCRCLKNHLISW